MASGEIAPTVLLTHNIPLIGRPVTSNALIKQLTTLKSMQKRKPESDLWDAHDPWENSSAPFTEEAVEW